uniref:Zinc finger protein 621 n=1 Tax=Rousettus aegyptiacus TaxID=9407 RepID=A0A7J8HXF2_ROUAE|nr:zinc finger protein 621 [Rousettus aegyptiacus]
MGQPGPCTEGPVQGGDAGELCKCGFPGISISQTCSDLPAGARRSALGPRSRGSRGFERHLARW